MEVKQMENHFNVVMSYLQENDSTTSVEIFMDRFHEVIEAYETVPENVLEAYEQLSDLEKWDILEQIGVRGRLNAM
jgi:hypothetical protein